MVKLSHRPVKSASDPSGFPSALLLGAGFVVLWNSGFIGAEYALPASPPFTLLFWRYWILAIILGVYLAGRKRLVWPGWRPVRLALLVGVLAHAAWLICVLFPLQWGVPAGIVALIVALQPLATGAFSGLVTNEPVSPLRWLGLIVGFGGVAIAVMARVDLQSNASLLAYSLPLGSVIAITIASLIQRNAALHASPASLPVMLSLFYQSLGAAVALTLPAVFIEKLETEWSPAFSAALLWLVIVVSFGAYGLMWRLIERTDATRVASLFYLGPPVTMLMAWAAFGDQLKPTDFLGLAVILAGVGLTQKREPGERNAKNV